MSLGIAVKVLVDVNRGIAALGFIEASLLGIVLMWRLEPGHDDAAFPAPTPGSGGDAR